VTDDSRPALPSAVAATSAPAGAATPEVTTAPARARRRWPIFAGLGLLVVAADQLAKALVKGGLAPGQSVDVVGDLVRIVFGQNSGALFGLFKDNALMFGIVSLAVVVLIVAYHARSASSLYLTVTLGLLLGGAIGNMLDRLLLGYVVDFVDVGIGPTRFYTFNVADSAISLAILLLFFAAVRPSLVDGGPRKVPSAAGGAPEPPAATDDDWGDGLEPDEGVELDDRATDGPDR
jgi:signal peptidase II